MCNAIKNTTLKTKIMRVQTTSIIYTFYPPNSISENQYLSFKSQLQNNPDFTIFDKNETFTKKYGLEILLAIILIPILGIGIIFILISMKTWNSYASYLRKKRNYFTIMENQIRKSKNYDEFYRNFYK